MVEGVKRTLAWDVEEQRFFGCGLRDLDAGGVVVGAPVERDLDAAAEAAGELPAVGSECAGVSWRAAFSAVVSMRGLLTVLSPFSLVVLQLARRRGSPKTTPSFWWCGLVPVAAVSAR